jgi:Fe-S cluster biosynthesis and repair protein YggX
MAAADIQARIERFQKMAQADPENELGHFSLGRAYLDAGMHNEAIASLRRVLQINPNRGPVYHLLAQAQLAAGRKDDAIRSHTDGVKVAAARGEMLARDEMVRMLQQQGAPIPQEATASAPAPATAPAVGAAEVLCTRCGRVNPKLPRPPFRNAQGQLILEKICAPCWKEWVAMGTKVINELRLPMNEPEAQKVYDKHMMEFLGLQ